MINDCFPTSKYEGYGPVQFLCDENDSKEHDPSPEDRGVQYQQAPVQPVAEVGEVEDLEVAAPPDKAHGADDHQGQDEDQCHARGVGVASHQSENSGLGGEHPVSVSPS